MDDRPAASAEKLLAQFRDWASETEMPGRTMSYLKTGFLPDMLNEQSDADGVSEMLEAWGEWEAGKLVPDKVLQALRDNGIETLLAGLAEVSAEKS